MIIPTRLTDNFGRRFPYLRLSLTDVCNFQCSYCLPDGYKPNGCGSFLSADEIVRLVRGFVALGAWKFRLTGGEPTVRPDFVEIVERVAAIPGVEKLAFTTNGYKLPTRALRYYHAGLRAINISIDTLDRQKFKLITGQDRLPEVLEGVDACLKAGFETIKINAVLLKDLNHLELDELMGFVRDKPISLRFIELMRTNDNQAYFEKHHYPGTHVMEKFLAQGWRMKTRVEGAGPAMEFEHPESLGTVGLIAPYSKDFCKSCNRLRVSARGDLHLCLFGDGGYPLREYLQADDQSEALQEKIMKLMNFKKSAHFLHDNNSGVREHLASIGG